MTGRIPAILRLMMIQAAWNYERMQGIGFAWGSLPLLRPLAAADPERHRQAVARAAEFFNANPFLAGAAAGATARAEVDGVPGPQVARLRTALCGPLGALGDQLFWMGIVPGLAATMLLAVGLGAGWWWPVSVVILFAAGRFMIGWWALGQGWQHGMAIGTVIQQSWLSKGIEWAGRSGALLVGLAIPVATWWLLGPVPPSRRWLALALALVLYRLAGRVARRLGVLELTVGTMLLTTLWYWSTT
ncbi:MAG: PTS system mannose/fructose/sorbose family transporter subunit IID [Gemmatimonadales bacterium]